MDRPIQKLGEEIDWGPVRNLCEEYMSNIANGKSMEDSDIEHYIFEETIQALYGKDVWKWINGST